MPDIYADFATGNDLTGTGTILLPYKTLQKAYDMWSGNAGDKILIGNSTQDITTELQLNYTTCYIGSYDSGGGFFVDVNSVPTPFTKVVANTVSGDIFDPLFQAGLIWLHNFYIDFVNSTSGSWQPGNATWVYYQCIFDGTGGYGSIQSLGQNRYIGCKFLECTPGSYSYDVYYGNYIKVGSQFWDSGYIIYCVNNIFDCTLIGGGVCINAGDTGSTWLNNYILAEATSEAVKFDADEICFAFNIIENADIGFRYDIGLTTAFVWGNGYYGINTLNLNLPYEILPNIDNGQLVGAEHLPLPGSPSFGGSPLADFLGESNTFMSLGVPYSGIESGGGSSLWYNSESMFEISKQEIKEMIEMRASGAKVQTVVPWQMSGNSDTLFSDSKYLYFGQLTVSTSDETATMDLTVGSDLATGIQEVIRMVGTAAFGVSPRVFNNMLFNVIEDTAASGFITWSFVGYKASVIQ